MIALTTGRFEEAVAALRRAVDLTPEDADARNSLGSALLQAGWTGEAIDEFTRTVEMSPDFAPAWFNLGGSYCAVGQLDRAQAVRDRLAALDPVLARRLNRLIADRAGASVP